MPRSYFPTYFKSAKDGSFKPREWLPFDEVTFLDTSFSEMGKQLHFKGRFWEFVEIAYAGQDALDRKVLPRWAANAGVQDIDLFKRCLASGIKKEAIMSDVQLGEELDVQGTPTFFVDGRKVETTLPALSAAIEEVLAKMKTIRL